MNDKRERHTQTVEQSMMFALQVGGKYAQDWEEQQVRLLQSGGNDCIMLVRVTKEVVSDKRQVCCNLTVQILVVLPTLELNISIIYFWTWVVYTNIYLSNVKSLTS